MAEQTNQLIAQIAQMMAKMDIMNERMNRLESENREFKHQIEKKDMERDMRKKDKEIKKKDMEIERLRKSSKEYSKTRRNKQRREIRKHTVTGSPKELDTYFSKPEEQTPEQTAPPPPPPENEEDNPAIDTIKTKYGDNKSIGVVSTYKNKVTGKDRTIMLQKYLKKAMQKHGDMFKYRVIVNDNYVSCWTDFKELQEGQLPDMKYLIESTSPDFAELVDSSVIQDLITSGQFGEFSIETVPIMLDIGI